MSLSNAGSTEIVEFLIRLKMQEMQRGLELTEQQLREFDRKAKEHLDKVGKSAEDFDKKGKTLKDNWAQHGKGIEAALVGIGAVSAATFGAVAASIAVAGKNFGDFQAQINALRAVSGAAAVEMERMEAKALALGSATKYSTVEMAGTEVELAKLGFTAPEVVAALDGITSAALASGTSLRDAGELTAGTIRGFRLSASDAGFVADVLAAAANKTALGFDDLSLSMKYVAPIASASNQSLTDMVAVMGVLSNSMIRGEQAGTSLRGMLGKLQAPSNEAAKYMEALGFSIEDADKKIKPFPQMIGELQTALRGLSDKSKSKVLSELFGLEGLSAAQVLMKSSREELENLSGELKNSQGASAETAKIMGQGLNHEIEVLKSSVEGLAISFGKELEPALVQTIQTLQNIVNWFTELDPAVKQTMIQVGLFVGVIAGTGGLAASFGLAALGASALIGKLGLMGATAGATATKLGALRAAVFGIPGLLGLGLFAAGNMAVNSVIAQMDAKTNEDAARTNEAGEGTSAQARLNAVDAKTKGDYSKLTAAQLTSAARDLAKARMGLQNELNALKNIPNQIAALQKEFEEKKSRPGSAGNFDWGLLQQIDDLKAQEKNSKQAVTSLEGRIKELDQKEAEIQKAKQAAKAKPTETEQIDPAKEALLAQENREKESKEVKAFFDKQQRAREADLRAIEQAAASEEKTNAGRVLNGQKLAEMALGNIRDYSKATFKSVEESGSACYKIVYETLAEAGIAAQVGANGMADHAYMALEGMKKNPFFQEMKEWDRKSKLPAGAVVVWDKGNSKSGHISIADGQGNELSDFKGKQDDQHYGGGAAHVFTLKESASAQARLNKEIAIYNRQIAEAIQFQSNFKEGSESWQEAGKEIEKLRGQAQQKQIDLTRTQAEEVEKLREKQEKAYEALVNQAESLGQAARSAADQLNKSLEQSGMFSLDKMSDDFDRDIASREKELKQLQAGLAGVNLQEGQRAIVLEKIKGLQAEISNLIEAQDNTVRAAENQQNWKSWKIQKEQELDFAKQADEVLKGERAIRAEILEQEARAFQARQAAGKTTPKEELQFQLQQNQAKRTLLEEELTIEEEKLQANKSNKEQELLVLRLRGQINDSRLAEIKIMGDFSKKIGENLEKEKQQRMELLGIASSSLAKMLTTTGLINSQAAGFLNSLAQAVPLAMKLSEGISGGWGTSAKVLPKEPTIALAQMGGEIYQTFLGEIQKASQINVDGITAMIKGNELNLLQLDNQITAQRIENKKRLGATAAEVYEDEKKLIESQAAAALKGQELQIAQLKAKKSAFFGLAQTGDELAAVILAEQMKAKETEKINEDKQARLLDLERQRLAEEEKLAVESHQRRADFEVSLRDLALRLQKARAETTGDFRTGFEAERDSKRGDALKTYEQDIAKLNQAVKNGTLAAGKDGFLAAAKLAHNNLEQAFMNIDKAMNEGVVKGDPPVDIEGETKKRERNLALLKAEAETLQALGTEDPFDDILANYKQALAGFTEEEAKAEDTLQGTERTQKIANINQQRLNAEKEYQKQLRDVQKKAQDQYLAEVKARLGQQKELIQERLKIDSQEYETLIRTEEAKLTQLQARIKEFQAQLDASRKARDVEKAKYNPNDGVQNQPWLDDMAAYNENPDAWLGVDYLSNIANRNSLGDVSAETARLGLKQQAKVLEQSAQIAFRSDKIDLAEFNEQMKKAQLLRARGVELELEQEKHTMQETLDLQQEWAEAYATYQDYASKSVDARYDAADKRIQENMDLEQAAANQAQANIDNWKAQISQLEAVAKDKTALIDAEILRVNQSTRDWASAWGDVTKGIEAAKAAYEKLAASAKLPGTPGSPAGGATGGSAPSSRYIPTLASKNEEQGFTEEGPSGAWYRSKEDMREAEGIKMNRGGFAPDGSQYRGDRYGPIYAEPKEAFVPFSKWPDILRPFMQLGAAQAPELTVLVTGNQIVGELDVYRHTRQAAQEVLREHQRDIANQVGGMV